MTKRNKHFKPLFSQRTVMFDQSYNAVTLGNTLRKSDFRKIATALRNIYRKQTIDKSIFSALTSFNGANPISKFHLKKKSAFGIIKREDELVVRKLTLNLERLTRYRPRSRSFVISNLRHFLEEGLPYRIYRLDIKSFYESFLIDEIKKSVLELRWLTPLSKRHLTTLLAHFVAIGGSGLPRGIGISAVLSHWLMSEFDEKIRNHPSVYYYGRYVDDITIVTNLKEEQVEFLNEICLRLPKGLVLNETKTSIHSLPEKTKPQKSPVTIPLKKFNFSYLGYEFTVYEPLPNSSDFRLVRTEIAPKKINKIKTRIIRTFLEFANTGDVSLLRDRIKFLTSNFDIIDKKTGKRKLSGIYYSYPLLSDNSISLTELDTFLRNAILSRTGRLFSLTAPKLLSNQKRELLNFSFTRGYKSKRFIHFSPIKIKQIQKCWIYE
jgi:hypothetical protein